MTVTKTKTHADFVLPASIVSRSDIARLLREVEQVDNEMTAARVRKKTGAKVRTNSDTSETLDDFLTQNKLTLDDSQGRSGLIKQLRQLKDHVPVVHMTFAAPADNDSLRKLVAWLRQSVHAQAVLSVGLQPALVGGVHVRTPNQIHDLSLRAKLEAGRHLLLEELEALHERN